MKVIEIEENGYVWTVPLLAIAENRADYYAARDDDTTRDEEIDYVMNDDFEGIDWFRNNMDFEDVEDRATLVKTPEPRPRPDMSEATCEIVELDDGET